MKDRNKRNKHLQIVIAMLAGVVVFFVLYGFAVVWPTNVDWLLNGEDLTQHYIGWRFFRNSQWLFPFGNGNTLAYPNEVSVIFTDSIPIFAVFFKLLSPILPDNFQYFGLWGLLSFILQGGISAKLIQKYTKSGWIVVTGSLLFILSPVMILRTFSHTALASQWIVLLGILFIAYYEELSISRKWTTIAWGALGILASSVHIYFVPMCGILLLGYILIDFIKSRKQIRSLVPVFYPLLSYLVCAAGTIALLGGFSSGVNADTIGLGWFSFNINAFVNPMGWSRLLKDHSVINGYQAEGFAYLGAGVILLLCFTVIFVAANIKKGITLKDYFKGHIKKTVLFFMCAGLVLIAVSPTVTFGNRVLIEVSIPLFAENVWNIFRCSGRFIWPVVYLMLLYGICGDRHWVNRKMKICIMTLCLLLQLFDLSSYMRSRHQEFVSYQQMENYLTSEVWEELAQSGKIKHLVFASDFTTADKELYCFGYYAVEHKMTMNQFCFARINNEIIREEIIKALEEADPATAFIFRNGDTQNYDKYKDLYYYDAGAYLVGLAEPLNGE